MSNGSFVEGFFESASGAVFTRVAYIRWLHELWADIFNVGVAVVDTLTAGPAAPGVTGKAFRADRSEETFVPDIKEAVIESLAQSTGLLIVDMVANLFGDGGTVFAEESCNPFEGSALIEFSLDGDSVFKDQMFIFIHEKFLQINKIKKAGEPPCLYRGIIHQDSEGVNSM